MGEKREHRRTERKRMIEGTDRMERGGKKGQEKELAKEGKERSRKKEN